MTDGSAHERGSSPLSVSLAGIPEGLREGVKRRLGIDTRALAAFRVSVGLLLLADLLTRGRHLVAFYTDGGALPRSALAESYPLFPYISLHTLSGEPWFQALLFAVAGVFALLLTVGYRTRLATVVSFVLLISLHARNPFLLNGGDLTLRTFLFIGIFLPLDERWSIEALRRGREPRHSVVSVATATFLLHVVMIYTTNAIFKLRGEMWEGGTAVEYALSIDRFTVLLGDYLVELPELLTAVTWLWLGMLILSSGLVVLTGRLRTAFVTAFVGAHLGMFLTLRLGLFPFISIAVLLPFLPPSVWESFEGAVEQSGMEEKARGTFASLEPRDGVLPSSAGRLARRTFPVVVGLFLVVSLAWQGVALGYVDMPEGLEGKVERSDNSWSMFAPDPTGDDGWYVIEGQTGSGGGESETVEAFGGDVDLSDPADSAEAYPTTLWHRYLMKIRYDGGQYEPLADYMCRRLGAGNGGVSRVRMSYYERPVYVGGRGTPEKERLIERRCG